MMKNKRKKSSDSGIEFIEKNVKTVMIVKKIEKLCKIKAAR